MSGEEAGKEELLSCLEVQASNEFHFMRDKEIQQLKINLMNSESRNGALKCELSNNQRVYEKDLRVMKNSMRRENKLMRKKLHEVEKNYNSVHMELWSTQRKYYQCQSDVDSLRKRCLDVVETLHEEKDNADF